MNKTLKKLLSKILFLVLVASPFVSYPILKQTDAAELSDAERAELEAELKKLEAEIKVQESKLNTQKNESASISRDISILQSRISAAKSRIKQKDLEIKNINNEISQKTRTITQLNEEIKEKTDSLEELLRKTNEMDYNSFTHAVLSQASLSDFYNDIDNFSSIKKTVRESVEEIRGIKEKTEGVKRDLEVKHTQEIDAKKVIEGEKNKIEVDENAKNQLLNISKTKEAEYAAVLAQRKAEAAKIRDALFQLRGAGPIPFGQAYDYAKEASQRTGVRPAYILAILKQESNLGSNVGTCNRPGDSRTWRDIMPGPNDNSWRDDQTAFQRITSRLGISPDGQPLSCPLGSGGWGGAMGPSQFIPTTWESYDSRIEATLGVATADPWNPRHAVTATALYVMDLGAGAKTFTAEREAACKYYSGRGCFAQGVVNMFYGNAVMAHAEAIQRDIDVLESF